MADLKKTRIITSGHITLKGVTEGSLVYIRRFNKLSFIKLLLKFKFKSALQYYKTRHSIETCAETNTFLGVALENDNIYTGEFK